MSANGDAHTIRILYIDDELNNLLSFQAAFRRHFDILIATTASEGLEILEQNEVEVIIADQRMPKMTGVEFFNIVLEKYPDPIRILLTGYADINALEDAINKGEIWRYIKKPWDQNELQNTIINAYEIYDTRRRLKYKMLELERVNEELNRFVYSTSHDLRSPLANIMGILNMAKIDAKTDSAPKYLNMIEGCVQKMDLFIHKIIEYYKGIRLENEIEEVEFTVLFRDSIELNHMVNPRIHFDMMVQQDVHFFTDAFRLSLIINNLVSNAVKYQRPNEEHPFVELKAEVNSREAVIEIRDNGVGIVPDHLNKIFDIFFRSSDFKNGLGIGLYIVKEALNRIKGKIEVSSEPGKGTQFKLIIPNQGAPNLLADLSSQ
ncbi:MAG: hybrid sensor histidine kinase/response regulator [Bacteroidota bacterium]|jgi:two-component system sensor histidine kinase/response regulator